MRLNIPEAWVSASKQSYYIIRTDQEQNLAYYKRKRLVKAQAKGATGIADFSASVSFAEGDHMGTTAGNAAGTAAGTVA